MALSLVEAARYGLSVDSATDAQEHRRAMKWALWGGQCPPLVERRIPVESYKALTYQTL